MEGYLLGLKLFLDLQNKMLLNIKHDSSFMMLGCTKYTIFTTFSDLFIIKIYLETIKGT